MPVTAVRKHSARTVRLSGETDFDGWREAARRLALNGVTPGEIVWTVSGKDADNLFAGQETLPEVPEERELKVPREFVERARMVICHSDPDRFAFLYRLLCRFGREPHVMKIHADADVRRFEQMEKSVGRDIHKM
ncbi:MAG: TIGR03915 family putative DNA repair protein, partial [Rhizobiaceae bacterium]